MSWFDAVVNECLRVDGFQRRAFSLANHRPPLRLRWCDAPPHPDAIRVPSWRQEDGDKRADLRAGCSVMCLTSLGSGVTPSIAKNRGLAQRVEELGGDSVPRKWTVSALSRGQEVA